MTYSINIHSSIVNPSKPNLKGNKTQSENVTIDISLLIKLLEFSKNNNKDNQLQEMVTNLLELKEQGPLSIDQYDKIVNFKQKQIDSELKSILKLAGI